MFKRKRLSLIMAALLMLALILSGCGSDGGGKSTSSDGGGSSSGGGGDTIKIGVSVPTTGPSAAEGKDMANGAEMAAKHINEAGGVLGKDIELVMVDDACDPQQAVTAANKLVQDDVSIVVGHYCSAAALPASGVLHKAGMPTIMVAANSPQLPEQGYNNLFFINSMVFDQGKRVADYLKDNNMDKLALIHDNSDYARDTADITKELHEKNGGKVIAFEAINPEEKDFGALATKLKSLNPDATYFTGFYNAGGLIMKQFKQKGVSGPFMAGDGNPTEPFVEVAGEKDAEGVILSQAVTINYVDTPEAKAFVKEYKETYGNNPLTFGHRQYDGIRLAADAIERVGDPDDKEALIKALSETKDFPAFGETYTFKEDGTRENADFLLIQLNNGKFEIVE
ncbi:branched-chain amino acid ABC transporter substrate-binding protein [Siminovitchia fortis]|nr:branched-chain amino acid ABC transporter substrate-binding protein [Siminovitchia fortis]